jgi:hypothetical protein
MKIPIKEKTLRFLWRVFSNVQFSCAPEGVRADCRILVTWDRIPEKESHRNLAIRSRTAGGERYSGLADEFQISSQRVGRIIHILEERKQ